MRIRDDDGVTLIEVLVATMIGGLISGVIASAFAVGARTTDTSNKRLAGSQGAQITTAFFGRDVQGASAISAVSISPCTGTAPNVATLSWVDVDALLVSTAKSARYSCRTSAGVTDLVRSYYEGSPLALVNEIVLVHDVTAARVECAPNCAAATSVTITAVETGGYQFSVSGSRRLT